MFRWLLLAHTTVYCQNILYLTAHSDLPCHNLLFWTPTAPDLRTSYPVRRGTPHEFRDKYLDVEWNVIEQNEPGDTHIKTFTWPGWPQLTERYYIFTATTTPYLPASTSPLFFLTSPADPLWTHIYTELFW